MARIIYENMLNENQVLKEEYLLLSSKLQSSRHSCQLGRCVKNDRETTPSFPRRVPQVSPGCGVMSRNQTVMLAGRACIITEGA